MIASRRASANDVGFGYSIDAHTARRQLNLSIGVVIVLALAIVTAALSLDARPISAPSYVVSVPTVTHQVAATVSALGS